MTGAIVNTATGEITEAMDEAAAERLSNRISLRLATIADNYEAVVPLIREAIERGADKALGYRSPGEYAADRFGGSLARLGIEFRQAVVRELTDLGMSTRAIAPVVGASVGTVHNDRQQVFSAEHLTQTSASSTDAEPKVASAEATAKATPSDEATATTGPEGVDRVQRPPVTGLDGKVYKSPEPRLRPVVLTDSAAEFDNAEKASKSLSNAIAKLLEFQHPNMRQAMRRYWSMASNEVPPTPRRDVTPEQMRVAAQGLLALADEWSSK